MKKTRLSKPLAILLALIMIMSLLPISALAADAVSAETLDETHIVLTMSGALTGTQGDAAAFTVGGVASVPTVTDVAVSGTMVILTLDATIVSTDTPTVSYTATGTDDLTDGTPVANFSNQAVKNNVTVPALPPTVSSAETLDETHIVLTMSGALTGTQGDAAAFTVGGVASVPTVTDMAVSGTSVTLTLSAAIVSTDTPTVSYTATGMDDLTDGTPVANFSNQAVVNNVAAPSPMASFDEPTELNVTISTNWAFVRQLKIFAYSEKDNAEATPIATAAPGTFSLDPGDYWIEGIMIQGSITYFLGGIKITVDADHTEFILCGCTSIKCGNTGWAEGTDYTKTVAVNNQDNSVTREIQLGAMGKNTTLLALENDTVQVTIIPSEAKKAEGYQETMGRTNPLTSTDTITVNCQGPVGVTFTAPAGSDILVGRQPSTRGGTTPK